MKFPPDSGGSPSATGAGGYWDGFLNGDDSFHKVINMLDFPLESVEEDKCVVPENWNAQFQSLGPMTSEILQGFAPTFKSDDIPNNFVQIDATSDTKQLQVVTEISSTHVPLNSSHLTNTRLFRTPSPSSVIESSSSCSAGKNMSVALELLVPVRTRTKIPRSSTFTRWHMLSPVTVTPREISNSKDKEKKEMKPSHSPNECDMEENSCRQRMPCKRCTHCQTQKTPQWRQGPMGPKTLCNACGVRYLSGRLVPEYRPAASYQAIKLPKINGNEKKKKKKIKLSGILKDNQIKEKSTYEQIRRCANCQATETPQWREGPMGPKTLCNACGVRYRSESKKIEKINTRSQEKNMGWCGLPNEVATDQRTPCKRCAHCQVTKTPQWREGPMGPKTLCNACGVRYRSGRLMPEYRPAASPTFVPTLHSNLHKQVIRMRKSHSEKTVGPKMDPEMSPPPDFVPMSSCYLYDN